MVQLDMDMQTANEELSFVLSRVGIISPEGHVISSALNIRDGEEVLSILNKYVVMFRTLGANRDGAQGRRDADRADAMQKVIDEQSDSIRDLATLSNGIILAHLIVDSALRDGAQIDGTVSSIAIILGYLS